MGRFQTTLHCVLKREEKCEINSMVSVCANEETVLNSCVSTVELLIGRIEL